jgi:hypothetical protein
MNVVAVVSARMDTLASLPTKEARLKALYDTMMPSFDSFGLAFSLLYFFKALYPSGTPPTLQRFMDILYQMGTPDYTRMNVLEAAQRVSSFFVVSEEKSMAPAGTVGIAGTMGATKSKGIHTNTNKAANVRSVLPAYKVNTGAAKRKTRRLRR